MAKLSGVENKITSTFLVIGEELDILNIKNVDINQKNIVAFGKLLDEGQDVFKIESEEQMAFIKAYNSVGKTPFVTMDSFVFNKDSYNGDIDSGKIPKNCKLKYFSGLIDSESSNCLDDLIERYDNNCIIKLKMQKYLRNKKINKIENS